jgi:energy-converting hydrogenase Eha subunit E
MDYVIECANIIYYHHILVLLGCLGLVAGISLWVKCSMVDFIEHLDEVGIYIVFLAYLFI